MSNTKYTNADNPYPLRNHKYAQDHELYPYYIEGFELGHKETYDNDLHDWTEPPEETADREARKQNWMLKQVWAFEEGRNYGQELGAEEI